jgi:hypothetical protein
MDLVTESHLAIAVIGLGLTGYGIHMLVTGRLPERLLRMFRQVRDAGRYFVCFGVAMMLLGLLQTDIGGGAWGAGIRLIALAGAVALAGVALVRYRPRRPPDPGH